MSLDFNQLVVVEILFTNVGLALQFLAFISLRYHRPDLHRPYVIPGGWPAVLVLTLPFFALLALVFYSSVSQAPALLAACVGVNVALVLLGFVWARYSYDAALVGVIEGVGAGEDEGEGEGERLGHIAREGGEA